jgi:hypothetical protein
LVKKETKFVLLNEIISVAFIFDGNIFPSHVLLATKIVVRPMIFMINPVVI